MVDQIIQFAKEQLGDNVKSEHGLSDDQHNEVFSTTQSSVLDSLKSQAMNGNLGGIMDLFNGNSGDANGNSQAVTEGVHGNVIQNLMDKFGFDSAKASGIAGSIVPAIIARFSSPDTGNATDAGDLVKKIGLDNDDRISGMLSKITGGGGGGIMDAVKGLFGGK